MSGGRARRIAGRIALTLLILLVLATIYAFTFAPGHVSNLQAETADGVSAHRIASASSGEASASVTPEAQWQVQPLVQQLQVPLLRDLPRPPLPNDPRIVLDLHSGILVTSPDAAFEVGFRVLPDGTDAARMAEEAHAELRGSDDTAGPPLREEALASGATIRHFSVGDELHGTVDLGGVVIEVQATAASGERALDDYRPALSMLVETLSAP